MKIPTTANTILLISFITLFACQPPAGEVEQSPEIPESMPYDSALAAQIGADDYGMKSYVMALLRSGPNRSQDSTEAARLQRAHMDNITRLANEGKLLLAGPFLDNGELRGIYVFDVRTIEEAQVLTATDPAIEAGRLVMELHPWYGSGSLMLVPEWHAKISKMKI